MTTATIPESLRQRMTDCESLVSRRSIEPARIPEPVATFGHCLARLANEPRPAPVVRPAPLVPTGPVESVNERDPGLLLSRRLDGLARLRAAGVPASPPAAPTADERRTFPRRESGCVVTLIRLLPGTSPIAAEWRLRSEGLRGALLDLGLPSAALGLPEPVEEGSRVLVRLENRSRGASLDVTGVVARCIPDDDEHRIVLTLDERLSLDDLLTFGHHVAPVRYV